MPTQEIPMEPVTVDALYDERSDVAWTRPILQGDVFRDIALPGWDVPQIVQIVAHPCAMRRGAELAERVTVARVIRHQVVEGSGKKGWDGFLRVMPLADLLEDGDGYAARLEDVTGAPSELLTFAKRVASLSNRGIYVLQQRLIKHYTRFTIDIPALRKQASPVLEEADEERDWLETILGDNPRDPAAINGESKAFDEWLKEGNPSRRDLLQDEANQPDIRRQAHREALRRASSHAQNS